MIAILDRIASLDRLPLWAASVPLGLYLLALGVVHLRRRPLAISGGWDWALLAIGVAGFVAVGPLAVVQPIMGSTPWTAILLIALFALFVALAALVARPRLVIYNISLEQLRPLVVDVVSAVDPLARWAGGTAALPTRKFEVRIDGHGPLRTVSIVAGGERPAAEEWSDFCARLRRGLVGLRVRTSPWGPSLLAIGCGVLLLAAWFAAVSSSPASAVHDSPVSGATPDASPRRSDPP